ncbi:hypothetical protein [Candidatus Mycolicibacterium alkanivorans]|uniref:Uncharacterized protein n=1 Tax=Candidatus Mycolicibacterium alkanivorans TaxID=2954114 RepID=A0ABS9YRY0_9MYCO|nr:hypothetical protein [Candidatus Mycolicibacterium alkanivorans]MCI4673977.1 hypothetical protein [Candidatus Mycolicibacterium alkanivorans]
MSATTDSRPPRPSPARWSKLAVSALSASLLLGIVDVLSATAHQRAVISSTDTGSRSGVQATTIQPVGPAPAAAVAAQVPAPVPAPVPAADVPIAPIAPHAVSKASGG